MYLLHIDSAASQTASISRQVAATFLDAWHGDVVHRDLASGPVPHLTAVGISARFTDAAERTPDQTAALRIQDELIEEFLGASVYLFTVPLYNYSMPSTFKAWLDQIMVVGRTFALPEGPPAAGRPAVVVSARGGSYEPGTPNFGMDHLLPTLETAMGKQTLGLEIQTIKPEMTLAPVVPALARFVELAKASMAESHDKARRLALELALTH